ARLRAENARQRGLAYAVRVAVALVIVGAVLHGLAFESIYTRPVTRVAASEWIYDHVPPGSRIGVEHWDDALPLGLPGREARRYQQQDFPLYNEENSDKRELLVARLDSSDYLVQSTNRLYGSIPKLPRRYR